MAVAAPGLSVLASRLPLSRTNSRFKSARQRRRVLFLDTLQASRTEDRATLESDLSADPEVGMAGSRRTSCTRFEFQAAILWVGVSKSLTNSEPLPHNESELLAFPLENDPL